MLTIHPLAEIFPPMLDEAFAELVDDIRENGLREPIIVHEGQVLDGRNRYRACLELGIEPIIKPWDQRGSELSYVISKNLRRRHLSESQRAMVADKIANMKRGDNQHASIEACSQNQAAKLMNVSRSSVRRAHIVRANGVPELQKAVEVGAVSVAAAAEIAQQAEKEQRQIVERGEKGIVDAARTIRVQRPKASRRRRRGRAARNPQRIRADIWIRLRDAIENLTGMPLPSDVVTIVRAYDRAGLLDMRLERSAQWLEAFIREWRKHQPVGEERESNDLRYSGGEAA
jgi:ParB-like chromosome segregation protein Spo0J